MIQIYTGNGKGKTTAALGSALRAAGAGLSVYIAQFAKGRNYSELEALKKIKGIKTEQFGRRCFIKKRPTPEDIALAQKGIKKINRVISQRTYDVVIMDEANIAVKLGLLKLRDILELIRNTPGRMELILTGRYAHPEIIKLADLVSEVKELKHYFKKGISARKGFEF